MTKTKPFLLTVLLIIFFPVFSCSENRTGERKPVFERLPELSVIKPERPVKIKLKRNVSGKYSWDLSGSDAERIIQADKKLRERIVKEKQD